VIIRSSAHDPVETARRFAAALGRRDLTLFARIDHSAAARAAGRELGAEEVIIFGKPLAGTALMQQDRRAGLDMPLRVLIWEDAEGTHLGYRDPHELGRDYDLGPLSAALDAMAQLVEQLVAEAAGAG
jgi:uncharacterized protein (DUF302 family)